LGTISESLAGGDAPTENNNIFSKEQDVVSRLYKTTTSITPSSFEAELY
jgi:hypothetical protein